MRASNQEYFEIAAKLLNWYPRHDDSIGKLLWESSYEDTVLADFRAFSLEQDQILTGIDLPQLTQALAYLLELGGWWLAGYGTLFVASSLNSVTGQNLD